MLLHPTSLPGRFGAGDLGKEARSFVDFAEASRFAWWQMLPLAPVGPGQAPYSSTSVFAGSRSLIDVARLVEAGLVAPDHPALAPLPAARNADFDENDRRRDALLRAAFARAKQCDYEADAQAQFQKRSGAWLDDFALFTALKRAHGGKPFYEWADPLRFRDRAALASARHEHADEIELTRFEQFLFDRDLVELRTYANEHGVGLMGDIPIFVAHDSADVWAHAELFQIDERGTLRAVAGVPPDDFSDDGQLWGNPLYDWNALAHTGYAFWIARLALLATRFDAIRFDHFIGFSRAWAIPTTSKSAKVGAFQPGPGRALFDAISRSLGPLELVAEDLGVLTNAVRALRDGLDLPGMQVLEFSFGPDAGGDHTRPHAYAKRSVVYTGTHDNDTIAGWVGAPPDDASAEVRARFEGERAFALRYLALDGAKPPRELAWDFVRAAFANQADTAIVPVQDLLGLGREARMNRPGIAEGNWRFRLLPGETSTGLSTRVAELARLYGRVTAPNKQA